MPDAGRCSAEAGDRNAVRGGEMARERGLERIGVASSERFHQIPLRVGIDEEDAASASCEGHPRLSAVAVFPFPPLVRDRDGSARRVLPPFPPRCAASGDGRVSGSATCDGFYGRLCAGSRHGASKSVFAGNVLERRAFPRTCNRIALRENMTMKWRYSIKEKVLVPKTSNR